MKRYILVLIALTISVSIYAQMSPKKIRAKNDYIHKATGFNFPLTIDEYNRADIYAFDKKKKNVGISYKTSDLKTTVSIYLYPAEEATENRLRDEYIKSMQSVANISENGIHAEQFAISYKNEDYKINGFKANIQNISNNSSLSVFECGEWFFKIRITSEILDTLGMKLTEQKILDFYKPTQLVKISHLNPKANIYFSKTAFADSILLGSAMGSAFKKLDWVLDNIDSLERASGFPGLYLEMHIASLKGFIEFEKEHPNFSKTKSTQQYLTELNSIIDNGFLEEFILEQFNMIMIIPENLHSDFEEYYKWKIENPISIDLNNKFYVISFGK